MQNFVNGEITRVAAFLTFLLYFNAEVIFLADKQAVLKMEVRMFCLSKYMVPKIPICFQLDVILSKKPLLVDQWRKV